MSKVLEQKKSPSTRSNKKESAAQKALDARRRLEERLENIKLERELREFDYV